MKRIYYILFISIMLFSCEKPISDFQSENFIKFFGSGYESEGSDVIELSAGGYVITGYDKTNDGSLQVFAAKLDQNGNEIWSKTYKVGTGNSKGKVVKEVSDGLLIAGEYTIPTGDYYGPYYYVLKTDLDGNEIWRNTFFNDTKDIITVNDMVVSGSNIYVAGYSYKSNSTVTEYFVAKLDISGNTVWEKYYPFNNLSAKFLRIFAKDENLIATGYANEISIITLLQESGNPVNSVYFQGASSLGDALIVGDEMFVLYQSNTSTVLMNLDSNYNINWPVDLNISNGRSIAYNEDGSLMICGNNSAGQFGFTKVLPGGTIDSNTSFKTFQGTAEKIISTKDKGLIIIGTTNSTYGTNIQLIKTDKDYFMLKN
jgi:hypothetical protein